MKERSFIRKMMILMIAMILLLTGAILAFLAVTYRSTVEEMTTSGEDYLELYVSELDSKLDYADTLFENLLYDNENYSLLNSYSETTRYLAGYELQTQMTKEFAYNDDADALVVAECSYDKVYYIKKERMSLSQMNSLKAYTLEQSNLPSHKASWEMVEIGEEDYICKTYIFSGTATAIFFEPDYFLSLDSRTDSLGDGEILLTDPEGRIVAAEGYELLEDPIGNKTEEMDTSGFLILSHSLEGVGDVILLVPLAAVWKQIRSGMLVILAIFLIIFAAFLVITSVIRRDLFGPMQDMQRYMDQIKEGEVTLRMEKDYGSREFNQLKDTFNRLMDEILGLKIQSYEKQIELQENELKCIKLQIRPHFFLNAMTTISSLSQQGKTEEIRVYIAALSKNIRYMFKSGLHTVPLEEELTHVENYFEMQELKYPGCVFYYIDCDPKLHSWRIPQMIIHTIIENEYKYAVSLDRMLTILIRISQVEEEGSSMLKIEIEDDGKGYPQDILERFSVEKEVDPSDPTQTNGSRVGLWSVRRMMELMYERRGLFTIANVEPHGCINVFKVPERAKRELLPETIGNKID